MGVKGGPKTGGRKAGVPNKATLARTQNIEEVERRAGRPLAVVRLSELGERFYSLGNAYSPLRERPKKDGKDDPFPSDERKSVDYHSRAARIFADVANYQSPKLQSTVLRPDSPAENGPIEVHIKFI